MSWLIATFALGKCARYIEHGSSNLILPAWTRAWAADHRDSFTVKPANTVLGLKNVHRLALPELMSLHKKTLSQHKCALVDVGAASYGPRDGHDYSDSLIFLELFSGACEVHAFDLSSRKLKELNELALHKDALRIHNLILSDSIGNATIRTQGGRLGGASNMWTAVHDPRMRASKLVLPMVTFDRFLADAGLEQVLYVKVDVQGADPLVARGMDDTLRQGRVPMASFEYSQHWQPGESLARFVNYMSSRGYSSYMVAADHAKNQSLLLPLSGSYWNSDLELCTSGGAARCVIDVLVLLHQSAWERRVLAVVNRWKVVASDDCT